MSAVATVLVLLLIALLVYTGLRDGAFSTTYALLRNLFAFIFAMTLAEPLAGVMMRLLTRKHPARGYFIAIAFFIAYGVFFATARWLKVKFTKPYVSCHSMVDNIAGPALGILNGVVVTGTVLVFWSLLPFLKYMPGNFADIQIKVKALDTGAAMLRVYGFVERRMGGSRPFLLDPEPLELDENNNGRCDAGDVPIDLNGNGRWDRGAIWRYHNYAFILPEDLEPLIGRGKAPQPQ